MKVELIFYRILQFIWNTIKNSKLCEIKLRDWYFPTQNKVISINIKEKTLKAFEKIVENVWKIKIVLNSNFFL